MPGTEERSVASATVTPTSGQLAVGATLQLSANAFDDQGSEIYGPDLTWSSSNPSIATVNSSGVVTGLGSGTAAIVVNATAGGGGGGTGIASATITVLSACGASNDPNIALFGAVVDSTAACTPSDADVALYSPQCLTGNVIACIARHVAARVSAQAACALNQTDTCMAWLNKLLAGDTSAVHLSEDQFASIIVFTTNATLSADTPSPVDPVTNTTYASAKKWNWSGTPWGYSIGTATVYYNADGTPAAFYDIYDFTPTAGQRPFIAAVQANINNVVNGKSFVVHYP